MIAMPKWGTFGGLVSALLIGVIVVAGGRAFSSPIALNWVYATVRVENEWGKAGTGFLVIRKIGNKQGKVFLATNEHGIHLDRRDPKMPFLSRRA
jgi:hypothetical protein